MDYVEEYKLCLEVKECMDLDYSEQVLLADEMNNIVKSLQEEQKANSVVLDSLEGYDKIQSKKTLFSVGALIGAIGVGVASYFLKDLYPDVTLFENVFKGAKTISAILAPITLAVGSFNVASKISKKALNNKSKDLKEQQRKIINMQQAEEFNFPVPIYSADDPELG